VVRNATFFLAATIPTRRAGWPSGASKTADWIANATPEGRMKTITDSFGAGAVFTIATGCMFVTLPAQPEAAMVPRPTRESAPRRAIPFMSLPFVGGVAGSAAAALCPSSGHVRDC